MGGPPVALNPPYPISSETMGYGPPVARKAPCHDSVSIKLSKTNYYTWKKSMIDLIEEHSMDGFINGDNLEPPEKIDVPADDSSSFICERDNPKYQEWKKGDEQVQGWILATLGDNYIRTRVEPLRTAQEMWTTLKKEQKAGWGIKRSLYLPLIKAVIDGDCSKTREEMEKKNDGVRVALMANSSTALMLAIDSFQGYDLVKQLVDEMLPADLAQKNDYGMTALHYAAYAGYVEAAKLLVNNNKDSSLPNVRDDYNSLPIHVAAESGKKEMVLYLSTVTTLDPASIIQLVNNLIAGQLYGIALTVIQRYPALAHQQQPSPLEQMVRMPSAFQSSTHLNFWQRLVYSYVHVENMENHSTCSRDIESVESFITDVQVENMENRNTCSRDIESVESFITDVHVENMENHSTCNRDIESVRQSSLSYKFDFVKSNASQKQPGLFWKVVKKSVPQIKYMREKKLIHHEALQLVKFLCMEIVKLDNAETLSIFGKALEIAARDGVHEVVEEIFYSFPSAIYYLNDMNQSVFHLAIVHRHANVFNILYQVGGYFSSVLEFTDESNNNGLHLAGCLDTQGNFNLRVSAAGAALQMQRELQWFKEVEKFISIRNQDIKNKYEVTPAMIFTETHHELVKEGEKWMKDTANSCIIVAALIVTIVFAAAITVPGGTKDATGLPFFAREKAFIIFAISNALALFSSISSLLMFLSILTSRYAEEDFLFTLPNRLIIGLATLFLSILFMMIAFGATLKILFGDKDSWILIPVIALACIPITLFAFLQFPLLVVMIKSTYGPGMFGKQHDRRFS